MLDLAYDLVQAQYMPRTVYDDYCEAVFPMYYMDRPDQKHCTAQAFEGAQPAVSTHIIHRFSAHDAEAS